MLIFINQSSEANENVYLIEVYTGNEVITTVIIYYSTVSQ